MAQRKDLQTIAICHSQLPCNHISFSQALIMHVEGAAGLRHTFAQLGHILINHQFKCQIHKWTIISKAIKVYLWHVPSSLSILPSFFFHTSCPSPKFINGEHWFSNEQILEQWCHVFYSNYLQTGVLLPLKEWEHFPTGNGCVRKPMSTSNCYNSISYGQSKFSFQQPISHSSWRADFSPLPRPPLHHFLNQTALLSPEWNTLQGIMQRRNSP